MLFDLSIYLDYSFFYNGMGNAHWDMNKLNMTHFMNQRNFTDFMQNFDNYDRNMAGYDRDMSMYDREMTGYDGDMADTMHRNSRRHEDRFLDRKR